jgi:ABC-type transport system involved in cytochrome c biogenesis permease subunit
MFKMLFFYLIGCVFLVYLSIKINENLKASLIIGNLISLGYFFITHKEKSKISFMDILFVIFITTMIILTVGYMINDNRPGYRS